MALETAAGGIAVLDDYECLYALVRETARGRWFLDEHAKRHRHAETQSLLAAMRRLERLAVPNPDSTASRRMQMQVTGLMEALALAKVEIERPGQAVSPGLRLSMQMLERHAAALSALFSVENPEIEPRSERGAPPQPWPGIGAAAPDAFVFDIPERV